MDAFERFLNMRIPHEPRPFEQDLVLPPNTVADLVTAADMLTVMGRGRFSIRERDYNDEDGVLVHYSGDAEFTEFAVLAKQITDEFKRPQKKRLEPGTGNLLTGGSTP